MFISDEAQLGRPCFFVTSHTHTHTRWRLTSATRRATHPHRPACWSVRRQLIRRRYRPRRLVVVRSISSGASRTLLCPPDERPGRRSASHLPVHPRPCLPEPVERLLHRHYSHPPTRPQLISDALAGKRTRLGSYKLPGRAGRPAAVWSSVNMVLGGLATRQSISSRLSHRIATNHSAPLTD